MNTKLVSSIEAVARSRLVTIRADALLVDTAKLLSDTQISLVVVCNCDGAMVGVITKTDIVQKIGRCVGSACMTVATDVMTRDVTYCRPTEGLPGVLSMMVKRGLVHVPVVDDHFRPLGVVNARDALWELMAEEKYEASLLRDYVMGIGYR
jgi:CBS domain-containing protein